MNFELQESVERLQNYVFGPFWAKFGPSRQSDHDVAQLEAKSFHMNFELQESVERLRRYAIHRLFGQNFVFWPIWAGIRAK